MSRPSFRSVLAFAVVAAACVSLFARPVAAQRTPPIVRFDANGKGIGKVGPASQLTYNTKTRTLELGNYDKAPSDLIDVTTMKR